ncbi:MAG: DNA repair protein RecN [Draconibacterium sp.]
MLTRLSISNYALIDKLVVDFHVGLNSVTGETGAGKSIILGALGLILGNRADLSVLKDKDEKCIVEGIFEIGNYRLNSFFEVNDLDYDKTTIIRREITPNGKTRAFINDTPVNLKTLQELGLSLIDIHSQHQNLELGNQKFQLNLVDTVSGSAYVLAEYQRLFGDFKKYSKQLQEVKEKSEKAQADLDYFQFQFNQLDEASLRIGEQEELESELEVLTHAEEIKSSFQNIQNLLDDERFSVIQNLKESHKVMQKIQGYISESPELANRLESSMLELKDIMDEVETLSDKIEYNPARIEQINDRLNIIFGLQQKHHVGTEAELIQLKDSFEGKINTVTGYENEIKQLEKQLKSCHKELELKATELTTVRKKVFPDIIKSIISDLQNMGMPKSKFEIQQSTLPEFTSLGKDSISFLFSANSDVEPAEISKIASGGEMSRFMLAIKNLLRNSKSLPTVIFDEIDSGVSGEIALKMGTIIKSFSSTTQIINITHLPQIAAKGDAHFVVYKYESGGKTFTSIKQLSDNERVQELAKMVGGENVTDSILKTAKELMK